MNDEQILQDSDYSYKSLNAQFNIDEAEGIVEAFAAGIGNKDSVGDICLPGCFAGSLKRRKPRVVWGHNWNEPIGKVLDIYEVGPNDPRLPSKMRKAGIGGLYVRVQFNMKSERGKEAFANVSFFGLEQEWSIGYKTLDAVFDPVQGANLLKEVELYEVSPVLHGANQLTGTISIKADDIETSNKDEVQIKREVLRDPKGGLTAAGRRHFKRTEGANLKPGVRGPADTPEKMRRKGSFLTRFFTNPSGPMKKPDGKPTRLALSAAAWGEPVPQNMEDAAKLAAKGRKLLERYEKSKKKKKDDHDDVETKNHVAAIYEAYNSNQNEAFGRASQLTRALATRFGGPVRLITADNDIAIFEMGAGTATETMRVAYHFDGDEFMFGTAQQVKPETIYIPTNDSTGSRINPPSETNQVTVAMPSKPVGSSCCPGCAGGKGDCDAVMPFVKDEKARVTHSKLSSLGKQLGFTVEMFEDGFILGGFGNLTTEAQEFVAEKIVGAEKKALTPLGMLAVNMNPATARDADQDRLVLEGIPTINFGRGVPDPTPFGLPNVDAGERFVERVKPKTRPKRRGRVVSRPDAPRMMPAVPDPDREVPDVIPEKPKKPQTVPVEKPEREKVKPRTPSRPTREPRPQPTTPSPVPEPIREPVPAVPRREPARQPQTTQIIEPVAAMASREVPENIREALREAIREPDEDDEVMQVEGGRAIQERTQDRLKDVGYEKMRSLMGIDDENRPSSTQGPTASMARTNKNDLGRKIWLERTYDNASLEDMARKYGISRQEARQLELRHSRSLRSFGETGPNRVGRMMVDDAAAALTEGEADLLRRRFDGELLEESAERLEMDRFAIRRMEQLALAKLRDAMISDEPTSSMGVRRRNQAAGTVRRPKGDTSPLTGRRKRQRIDPTILEMVDSLKDTGPSSLTDSQRFRIATMMRIRRKISNKIDEMMASGAKRRIADLSDDVRQLDQAHEGPFANTTEAAHMALGTVTDIAGSMVKMANNDHDPLDVDSSVNAMVFNAVDRAGGDIRSAARSLGMSPEVVASRYNSHALRVLGSSTPGREMVRAAISDRGDLLDDTETATVLGWLNGMADADIAENIGSSFTPSQVVEKRAAALRKIGVNVGSNEMRRKIVSGRIFYNEHGLYTELVDQNGNIVKNRIGDGPVGSMSGTSKRVITADFGDGPNEYAISSSARRENGDGENVSLVRIAGDDELSVSSLIGREILNGDDRNALPKLNGVLLGGAEGDRVLLDDGRQSPILSRRLTDDSLVTTPLRESLRDTTRLKSLVTQATEKKLDKLDGDVEISEKRVEGLEQALRHFDETGEWLGEDFGVSFWFANENMLDEFIFERGIDAREGSRRKNESGEWVGEVDVPEPFNLSSEEIDETYANYARQQNPNATEEEVASVIADRRRNFRKRIARKLDIAKKESDMRRFMAESKKTRTSQNMVDLEDVPSEVADMLGRESDYIRTLSSPRSVYAATEGSDMVYVAHKGPHMLDGGLLDPGKTQGIAGQRVGVAGNTALLNQNSSRLFIGTARAQRKLLNGAKKLRDFLASGENRLLLDEESSEALKRWVDERIVPSDGVLDLARLKASYPNYDLSKLVAKLDDLIPPTERQVLRYEKAVAALERSGGNYLSAEIDIWEAIRGIGSYYARYALSDIPEDVQINPPEWRQSNFGESRKTVDEYMAWWWQRMATRGGTWLVAGEKDSQISQGVVGTSNETQILAPMKPIVGVSTRWGGYSMHEAERDLYARLSPAIFARAVKQHKRDGFVDVDTLLSDPDLAPDGYVYDGPIASMALRFGPSSGDRRTLRAMRAIDESIDGFRWRGDGPAATEEERRRRVEKIFADHERVMSDLGLSGLNSLELAARIDELLRMRRTRPGNSRFPVTPGDSSFDIGPLYYIVLEDGRKIPMYENPKLITRADRIAAIRGEREIDSVLRQLGDDATASDVVRSRIGDEKPIGIEVAPTRLRGTMLSDEPTASMSSDENKPTPTSKGMDLVERSDRFYPVDNNRLIDFSRMSVSEQDEMFELADKVRYGLDMTPFEMISFEMLVRKAERINAPRTNLRKNPHESDEVVVDEIAAGGDPFKMRWRYVDPETGEETLYELKKVGMDHPAARLHYVRVRKYQFAPNGEWLYAWNHPENESNPGNYGSVQNWPEFPARREGEEITMRSMVGEQFLQDRADIQFQRLRTRALDEALGVGDSYPKPWEVEHEIESRLGNIRPLSRYKAQYFTHNYYEGQIDTVYGDGKKDGQIVETDDSVFIVGGGYFEDIKDLIDRSRATNKAMLINTYGNENAGDELSPSSRYLTISSPELVFGRIRYGEEGGYVFEPLDESSTVKRAELHLLGTDELGKPVAVAVSNIVMYRGSREEAQKAKARSTSDAMREPTRAFSVSPADAQTDGTVTVEGDSSDSVIAAAQKAVSLSSETGLAHDLIFSYPSSTPDERGYKKTLKKRRLRDVEVMNGVWDAEQGKLRKATPDEEGASTYVVGTELVTDEEGVVSAGERKTFNVSRIRPASTSPNETPRVEPEDRGRGTRDDYASSGSDERQSEGRTTREYMFDEPSSAGTETEERGDYPHDSIEGTLANPIAPSVAARALDGGDIGAIEARQKDQSRMMTRWRMERPNRGTKFPTRRNWRYEIDDNGRRVPKYPFRKAVRPWGGKIKSVLDGVRSWKELADFMKTNTIYMIDWETTGMVAGKARDFGAPLQVAVFKVVNGEIVGRFIRYMNPKGVKLSQWAKDNLKRDGVPITDELAATFDDPEMVMKELLEFIGKDAILMGHNLEQFDLPVFKKMLPDYEIGGWIDTLAIANSIFELDRARMRRLLNERHPDAWDMVKWVSYPKYGARYWKSYTGPLKRSQRISKKTGKPYFTGEPSTSLEALTNYFGIKVSGAHDAEVDGINTVRVLGKMLDLASRWDADPDMFDPDMIDWRDKDESEVHAAAVIEWEAMMRAVNGQRETLFDDDGSSSRGRPGSEQPPRPGPSSSRKREETRFDPNRRVLQTLDNGVGVVESRQSGVYFEIPNDFSIRIPENAASVLGMIKQGQDGGFGISFVYGSVADGVPRRQQLFSLEVVPKRGLTAEQAKARGLAGYELHGVDPISGLQQSFDMEFINSKDAPDPKPSDINLPVRHQPSPAGLGVSTKKLTSHQYADYVRRSRARSSDFDGPTGSMSGLTNRDGVENPFSYWQYGENDRMFSDMSTDQVALVARESRRRFETAFRAGPSRNSEAMAHLDAIAAANRTMRVRSSNPVDDSGLRATVDEVGYKLEGSLEVPTFSTESGYAIPAVGSARRVELAKNASISSAFNSIIASNRRGNAIRALSRITGIKENELRARLSSHDLETYRNAMSNDRLAELYARISDGSVSPASLGFVIPDDADLQTAARISNNFGRMTSSDGIGPTAAMSVRDNYSSMNLQDLIREFNEAVDELFGFGRDGRYDSAEFKVKADSVKNRISNISSEIRRRYFESDEGKAAIAQIISDGPTASMSSEQPDLPIISGSAWLDTRLFEIYGEDKYETVARRIGARFDDLPSRNWNDPSDDDLVDIYHYAMMLGHDEMVEVAVRTGDFTSDAFEPTRASDFDARGATGIFARLSGITGLSPSAVEEYVDRGRNTATIRRLAAMDPYARVEEMNMMRRRNAFRRLLDDKKKELGEGFSDWLAQATMRNEDMLTDLNGRPMSSSMIESMGGPYIGFFGETPSEAMKRMAEYYGEEAPDEPTAAMSRRNFIPPRYDIKPHDGGWVIIDTANRNAISSRVFRDRLQALRGAKKMDRGDRSFNPFASDDPTAGMSSALPSTLRIPNDEARRFGAMVTRDQVSAAVSNYRNGRASLPYPSANYASPQQLMEGWVASDASLDTVMGRLEYLAKRGQTNPSGAENKAREIESLVNHLYKLQRRRNYFYNQLRDRLSSENPEMANILESWNSTRSGKNRESASNGERGLPFYNLPGGLSTYGYDENRPPSSYDRPERWAADADSRRFESFVSDFANAQINGAAGGRNASDIDQRNFNSIGKTVNDRVNVAVEDYIQNAQTRPIVKQAAKILDMANELKSESRNVDFLVDSGALEMMKMGGPRASAAFLVNAVSLGLVSSDRAKEMLDSAKADGMGKNAENYNLNRLEGARFKTNLSRIVSRLPIGRQRSRRN